MGLKIIVPILLSSAGIVYHHFGAGGLLLYIGLGPLLVLMSLRLVGRFGVVRSKFSWWDVVLFALLAVSLLALFIRLNPTVRATHDRGEALNTAAGELIKLRFPYASKTHLGNKITPMPGGILLSLPFYLLGDVAYMNWFWLAVWFALLVHSYRATTMASVMLIGTMIVSPVVVYEFVTGGDLFANSVAVTAGVVMIDWAPDDAA